MFWHGRRVVLAQSALVIGTHDGWFWDARGSVWRGAGYLTARCSAAMPPVRLRQRTLSNPAEAILVARPA